MKQIIILLFTFVSLFALDINSATKKELIGIKGIGPKKAKAILHYRKKHKCFQSVDELIKVKGIGKKFMAKHKDELEAKECEK